MTEYEKDDTVAVLLTANVVQSLDNGETLIDIEGTELRVRNTEIVYKIDD